MAEEVIQIGYLNNTQGQTNNSHMQKFNSFNDQRAKFNTKQSGQFNGGKKYFYQSNKQYQKKNKKQQQQQYYPQKQQKSISSQNIQEDPNNLLNFQYQEEDQYFYSKYESRRKQRQNNIQSWLNKDQIVQSSLRLIVNNQDDYMLNMYDSNEVVDWKQVVQVVYNMINSDEVKCPICLENLDQMVVPRITKCGHIFCWPCILQYLAFQKQKNWKKCPLCNDPVYKVDLKSVIIKQNQVYKVGDLINFSLMVRSKSNIVVKNKFNEISKSDYIQCSIPRQDQHEYQWCKINISNKENLMESLYSDLEILRKDKQLMESSQELEKVPYIDEAIDFIQKQIFLAESDIQEEKVLLSFDQIKKKNNIKNKQNQDQIYESFQDCYYFYQSENGENLFLSPFCYKILSQQYQDYFPLQIKGQIQEIIYKVVDNNSKFENDLFKKSLWHLPSGLGIGLVEIDLSEVVDEYILDSYQRQINYKEKNRKKKQERENSYFSKIENFNNEKFEQIKREACQNMTMNVLDQKPNVIKNVFYQQNEEDSEENKQEEIKNELWNDLGNLMADGDHERKDIIEAEESWENKKLEKKEEVEKNEFECQEDGFQCVSNIIIMQAPKKGKRKRRK